MPLKCTKSRPDTAASSVNHSASPPCARVDGGGGRSALQPAASTSSRATVIRRKACMKEVNLRAYGGATKARSHENHEEFRPQRHRGTEKNTPSSDQPQRSPRSREARHAVDGSARLAGRR